MQTGNFGIVDYIKVDEVNVASQYIQNNPNLLQEMFPLPITDRILSIWNKPNLSLLQIAAYYGALNCFNLLMQCKALYKPNTKPNIIACAAAGGNMNILNTVINWESDISDALFTAIAFKRNEIFCMLQSSSGTPPTKTTNNDQTFFHIAAAYNNVQIFQYLLNLGVNVNQANTNGSTPLHLAIIHHNEAAINTLLTIPGIEVNRYSNKHGYPIHLCISENFAGPFRSLVQRQDIDLNVGDHLGQRPLSLAIRDKRIEFVQVMIANPTIQPDFPDCHGQTSLMMAIHQDSIEIFSMILMLQKGNINQTDEKMRTALHHIVDLGKRDYLLKILQYPINVNARDSSGQTPLMIAANKNNVEIFSILLSHPHINVNLQDYLLNTALHYIVEKKSEQMLNEITRRNDLDWNLQNKSGDTAFHMAVQKNFEKGINIMLFSKKINPDARNYKGVSIAMLLAQNQNSEFLKAFFQMYKVDVTIPDFAGDNLYHYAAKINENLKVLDSFGLPINPTSINNQGKSPSVIANKEGKQILEFATNNYYRNYAPHMLANPMQQQLPPSPPLPLPNAPPPFIPGQTPNSSPAYIPPPQMLPPQLLTSPVANNGNNFQPQSQRGFVNPYSLPIQQNYQPNFSSQGAGFNNGYPNQSQVPYGVPNSQNVQFQQGNQFQTSPPKAAFIPPQYM
ncbi:hypothetical protein TVAG_171760 [Trichomonas vaginalis G3]|uniref:Uncharacterized protein n=1 Tax=Trichomonas vaginalis (strain ATCC PRA-98 / G3) TaxID=412133 RepID=A2EWA1_TRIV3|nr:protein ubiquitination [Trichomonas vaginalis G3]EAY03078.1 hypothetical protein TVAG_171760 [Trichomonas vaginalis G3]KAI5484809.1 protein ubiquitination [Trichomonas vaginalis G3]|eukprot:XP_001315301.1 hypothetical protein [Trichomonas vaginalis G3]